MSDQPACYGECCVANPYYPKELFEYIPPQVLTSPPMFTFYSNPASLTENELEVLQHLVEAWNKFIKLDPKPDNDFTREYNDAIHRCQQIIALRVAQRVDPMVWRQLNNENLSD